MNYVELQEILNNPTGTFHVRIPNGARAGSIAKVIGAAEAYGRIYVGWDNRPGKVKLLINDLILLRGYTGPTVWAFAKSTEVRKGPTDTLGQEFKLDDLVYYRVSHSNHLGVVTEISPSGAVYCTRVGGTANAVNKGKVERVPYKYDSIIIKDNLPQVIMLRKLKG